MAVTIREVAQRAGVSKAAVSYVLNGRETAVRIPSATQQRIRDAARELDYHPNALARGLARRRTDTVSLVLHSGTNFAVMHGFTGAMLQGVTDATVQLGYDLILHTKTEPTLDDLIADVTDGRSDGALLMRHADDPLVTRLQERGFPFVLMFGRHVNPGVWLVDCDNVLGGRLATEYLLSLGHRRILHLTEDGRSSSGSDRREGYKQALRDHGLRVRPEWIVDIYWEYGEDRKYDRVRELLTGPNRPTAIFAWYDGVAARALQVARELGLRVPEDLSIIGFDSTALCEQTDPPLTSVRQPVQEMAHHAMTMLAHRLRGEPVAETQKLFTPSLDRRSSCGLPAATILQ